MNPIIHVEQKSLDRLDKLSDIIQLAKCQIGCDGHIKTVQNIWVIQMNKRSDPDLFDQDFFRYH